MNSKNRKLNFVDLFCGAGGLTLGFENLGFQNIFSLDCDKYFTETYKFNFPSHNLLIKKIEGLEKKEISNLINGYKIDVIMGGPPCQGFSLAGKMGRRFIDDPRNYLFKEFIRVVSIVKPNFVVMENVERLYTNKSIRDEIIKLLTKLGYNVKCEVLNAVHYRVPQNRRRVFFIASLSNKKIIFPRSSINIPKTVKDVIDDLPKLKSGSKTSISNHESMNHTEQMLKKMSYIKDGGDRFDIPESIRPKSGDVRKYIRYNSLEPSICITGDMRKVFHYSQNRALTVRELARIQTFPDNFIFQGPKISQQQQVGNAVPPLLAEAVAKAIIEMSEING